MRPEKHLKAITSQVEILEDLKSQLENLLQYVNNIIKEGMSWIEDNTIKWTFLEMNQFMISETSQCMQTCLNIANNQDDNQDSIEIDCKKEETIKQMGTFCKESILPTNDEGLNEKLTEMNTSYEKKFEQLTQMLRNLEKQNETILREKREVERNTDAKIEEIMTELHAASDYISHLHSESESVSKRLEESNSDMLKKISDYDFRIENVSVKQVAVLKNEIFDEMHEKNNTISKMCSDTVSKVEQLSSKVSHIENLNLKNMTSLFEALRADVESIKLNVTTSKISTDFIANDHAKTNAEMQRRVTTLEVQTQHVSKDVEDLKEQKDKHMAIGFQARFDSNVCNDFDEEERIECYEETLIDLENNFDLGTGIFTAPVDGVYLCSLSIDTSKYLNDCLRFEIVQKEISSNNEYVIVETYVRRKDTMASGVGLVQLSKNDQLYVRTAEAINNVELSDYSQFMCVLLREE